MTNYEESAKAYENDYKFAPVGMAVGAFWLGAFAAAMVAFIMSCGVARGFVPTTIHGNQRVVFSDDSRGLLIGLGVLAGLVVIAVLLGLAGLGAVAKKRELAGLWKISFIGVPLLSALGTVTAIVLLH